jgi:hypothetical protein
VITMMDFKRRFRAARRRSSGIFGRGGPDDAARRPSLRLAAEVDFLERRELLTTVQDFTTAGGTPYAPDQVGLPPGPTVLPNGPSTGLGFLQLTNPNAVGTQNNSISFDTSDPGTYQQAVATFQFRITPGPGGTRGNGLGFALLNTGNYGTAGLAASPVPEEALFTASLGVGFVTTAGGAAATDNAVVISYDFAPVQSIDIPRATLDLASGVWITAQITVNFSGGTVGVVLTPSGGQPIAVAPPSGFSVPGLAPYQSRANFGARAQGTTQGTTQTPNPADIGLATVNVTYTGLRQAGTIHFGSSSYSVNEDAGVAAIDIVRAGGTAGSFTIDFVSADGTARNGLNYTSVAGTVTFAEGQTTSTVNIPIIDDGVYDGNTTVNLYISNPTLAAPLGTPITSTLTIVNTDPYRTPPTVSRRAGLVYFPNSRRVEAFQLTFNTPMAATAAENIQNYTVFTPANRYQRKRTVAIAQAVLDPTGTVVTLYRLATDRTHLAKSVRIIVRGSPLTGLTDAVGTFLAGVNGQAGTDAEVIASI